MKNKKILYFQEGTNYILRNKNTISAWILQALRSENHTAGEINIIFCSDDFLYQMNRKYLNHDTLTDIITFDYSENTTINGELFISIERVKENAKNFGVKLSNEIHRVIIHGIMHLCGYGDKNPEQKMEMTEKENHYLAERPEKLRV